MTKRMLLAALTGAAMLSSAAPVAAQSADTFPNRPIRIIVPQAAGSGVDLQARALAQKMGELWGHQGVVENRPGANAIIGMEAVATGDARRLHAGLCAGQRADGEPVHLQEAVLRSAQGLRADHPDRRQSAGRHLQSGVRHQIAEGPRRAGQGQSRQPELRLNGHRQHDPSAGRAAVACRRHQDDARAVPRPDAHGDRHPGRPGAVRVHDHGRRDRSCRDRKAHAARHLRPGARSRSSPTRRRPTNWASSRRWWSAGPVCLRRRERPRPIVDKLYAGMAKALASGDVKETILKQGSRAVAARSPEDFARYIKAESDKFQAVVKAAGLEGSQ